MMNEKGVDEHDFDLGIGDMQQGGERDGDM